ncbi:MAG: peptidoglycan DD-metalloendopeptidase family protein [Oscillospiraceae bacterium]|nr:peptidoglycan DD-metalloendopeptidase family protein [Oscillospiraceae bacterium]
MRNQTGRIRRLGGILLVLTLVWTLWPLPGATASSQSEINRLKEQQAQYQQRLNELKNQLNGIKDEQAQALEKKDLLLAELDAINGEIASIDAQIAYYDGEIAQKEVERQAAAAREEEQSRRFCQRVRMMEEDGNLSYWSILFSARDFADLLDRVMMVNDVMEYDNALMNQLTATRQQIEDLKAGLEADKASQEEARAQQEARKEVQSAKIAEANELLDRINADADKVNQMLDAENSELAKINAEITQKQKEQEAQRQQNNVVLPTSSGGYRWPLNGYTSIISGYGGRIHPVTGVYKGHTGIDIPAPSGTPIHAVKGGQVVTSTDNGGSYGRYVVVDHGNGNSSLYAHMSARNCSVGDIVQQGQVIGYVGRSGRTTGNHLHLEIRINYTRVNPKSVF